MRIIPAVDLQHGKCVRLFKGDFSQTTEYSDDPVEVARRFAKLAVSDLHVVDLDGARTGAQLNQRIVAAIAEELSLTIQLGGGIRNGRTVLQWLDSGVSRCVIGSLAITDPSSVMEWFDEFGPERIVLALDVKLAEAEPMIATHGWTRSSDTSLWDCLDRYGDAGLRHVLCTDVSRDGAMAGPNVELYTDILRRYPELQLQASGGVRNIGDMVILREAGIPAAITGRALLDGEITPAEVSSFRQNA